MYICNLLAVLSFPFLRMLFYNRWRGRGLEDTEMLKIFESALTDIRILSSYAA